MGGGQHGFRDRVPKHSPAQLSRLMWTLTFSQAQPALSAAGCREKAALQSGLWLSA